MIPIFPQYKVHEINYYGEPGYEIYCNVRIKHTDGIWYLVFCRTMAQTEQEAIRMFIDNMYKAVLFYKVDPKAHYTGFMKEELVNKPDRDQRDEYERLFHIKRFDAPGSTIPQVPISDTTKKDNASTGL